MFGDNIDCKNLVLGKDVIIEDTAIIRGINGPAENVFIGDSTYIGHNVQIICDNFKIGDYGKIHHDTNIHGYKPCSIGHNAWIGQFCIIDSIGGTTIGNNCGIGAHSQLWSHIKYGDTLEGCRFFSKSPLQVGNDVWFVGHCIVSAIKAEDKSMALVGSVVTSDMKKNCIYAGSPAKDITKKIGNQFRKTTVEEKFLKMNKHLEEFEKIVGTANHDILIVKTQSEFLENKSCFSVSDRTYTKRSTLLEKKFMKFLLPEKRQIYSYLKLIWRKMRHNPYKIVKMFEETVADYCGSKYAVSTDNCTDALLLCCEYFNVQEVIIPNRTYLSVPQSIMHAGGTVKFKDYRWKGVYQLEPYPIWDAAKRLTSDMYIPGSFMCLSFHIKKHLKIGKGGMILTDDEEAAKWFRKGRYEGRGEVMYHQDNIQINGWNAYMSPEQAARGLMLMQNYPDKVEDLPEEPFYRNLKEFDLFKDVEEVKCSI